MNRYISKILYILGAQRKKLIFLLCSFIFVSIIEAFGIGLIGPFVSLATDPSFLEKSAFLSKIYRATNLADERSFIAAIGGLIVITFCVKSFILWRVRVGIYSFSSRQQVILREKLMHAYLEAPYTFHLKKNSAHIINNVLSETFKFTYRVLNPFLEMIANAFVVVFMVVLLSLTSLVTVLSVLVIFLPLVLLFNRFKVSIAKWGKEGSDANQSIVRIINHGLGGVKETTIIGCGGYFKDQLVEEAERFSSSQKQYYAFTVTPRILIETLLVIFLIGLTSCFLLFDQDVSNLTALLSIFAIASMRLIPAATQLANGFGSLKNSSYTVNKLYADLKELDAASDHSASKAISATAGMSFRFGQEIVLNDLTYAYPGSDAVSLEDLSLTIKKGESIALIGQSGAGKTTLVDVILGLLIPQAGDISVDGKSIYDNVRAWQNLIGYIPQSIFLIEDTIERNIAFGVPDHLIDSGRLQRASAAAQLSELISSLPDGIQTSVGERGARLSGGQRQRIGIARALYHEREILVLDEATAALDNETERLVTESIKALSGEKTMIIIAHRLTTVEHCDRVYYMDKGTIARSGSYEEIVLANT